MKLENVQVQEMSQLSMSLTSEEEQYYSEVEAAEKDQRLLENFHGQVHPQWDDMTLSAWLQNRSVQELKVLQEYLAYTLCYTNYAVEGKTKH